MSTADLDAQIAAMGGVMLCFDDGRDPLPRLMAEIKRLRVIERAAREYHAATEALIEHAPPQTEADVPAYHAAQDRQATAADALEAALKEVTL